MKCLAPLLLLVAACAEVPAVPPSAVALPAGVQAVSLPGPRGVVLRAALALPQGPATAPVVVALHGCAGIGLAGQPLRLPRREREWAARLTEAGHPVLFPDSFGSRGLGEACGQRDFAADPEQTRREDAHAAAAWALAQPWTQRGEQHGVLSGAQAEAQAGGVLLLGGSHGGSTVLGAVAAPVPPGLIRAAVAYYPGCLATLRGPPWHPAVPLLMLLGEVDNWTPPTPCLRLAEGQAAVEVRLYPNANHGFDAPAAPIRERRLPRGQVVRTGTEPLARAASISRIMEFLATHGGAAR